MVWRKEFVQPARNFKHRRQTAGERLVAECFENRMLLSGASPLLIVSFADPANLTVASGTQMSFDVHVDQLAPLAIAAPISGNVNIEWWNGSALDGQANEGGSPIGTGAVTANGNLPVGSESDAMVAVTLNKSAAAVGPMVEGGYLLVAVYSGGGGFSATGSSDAIAVTFSSSTVEPSTLDFVQNPTSAVDGQIISPPVTVAIENASGSVETTSGASVTLAIAGGGTALSGTTTELAINGVATFSDLSIASVGTYTLTATSGTDVAGTSTSFNIIPGQLVFIDGPQDGSVNDALSPAVTVALEDGNGNVVTSNSTELVQLSLLGSPSSMNENTATLLNGVATFSDIVISQPGSYQLQATDGVDASTTSGSFNVSVASDQLVFTSQPSDAGLNSPITLSVEIENAANQVDTTAATSIQLSLNNITGGAGAVLTGNLVAPFVLGIATFGATAGISINVAGTYSLTATDVTANAGGVYSPTNLTSAIVSESFIVSPDHLVITKQPVKTGIVNAPIVFTVALENAKHKIDKTQNLAVVQVALNTITGGDGAELGGTTAVTFVKGVAKFTAADALSINIPGTFSLALSEAGASAGDFVSTRAFKILGLHLAVHRLARTVELGNAVAFTVSLLNARNQVVKTESGATVELTLATISSGGSASLGGSTSAAIVKGIATFTVFSGPIFEETGMYSLILTDVDANGSPNPATAVMQSHRIRVIADHSRAVSLRFDHGHLVP